jgi:hypothetical protein
MNGKRLMERKTAALTFAPVWWFFLLQSNVDLTVTAHSAAVSVKPIVTYATVTDFNILYAAHLILCKYKFHPGRNQYRIGLISLEIKAVDFLYNTISF